MLVSAGCARCGGAVSWLCRLRTFLFQPGRGILPSYLGLCWCNSFFMWFQTCFRAAVVTSTGFEPFSAEPNVWGSQGRNLDLAGYAAKDAQDAQTSRSTLCGGRRSPRLTRLPNLAFPTTSSSTLQSRLRGRRLRLRSDKQGGWSCEWRAPN